MFGVNISKLIWHIAWQFGLVDGLKLYSSEKCMILQFYDLFQSLFFSESVYSYFYFYNSHIL